MQQKVFGLIEVHIQSKSCQLQLIYWLFDLFKLSAFDAPNKTRFILFVKISKRASERDEKESHIPASNSINARIGTYSFNKCAFGMEEAIDVQFINYLSLQRVQPHSILFIALRLPFHDNSKIYEHPICDHQIHSVRPALCNIYSFRGMDMK